MPTNSIPLTDVAAGVWHGDFQLSEGPDTQLAGSSDWSIRKRTLRGGLSDGIDVVDLDNGRLSVSILPTRGMGLWRGRVGDVDLGWQSPVGLPVHPAFVNLHDRNGLGWLAGFNELLCRCGLAFNGPPGADGDTPVTLHGKVANTPAHRVDVSVSTDGPGRLAVTGVVDETTMFGSCLRLTSTVETAAGSNRLRIVDDVMNPSGHPAESQLLYHTNIGRPLLEEGAQFVAPVREAVPRDTRAAEGIEDWQVYGPPTTGYAEQVYFVKLHTDDADRSLVLLKNAAGDRGVSLTFDHRQLPWFSLWKNTQPEADGYVTGLEPAVNLPNFRAFEREQGRVITLEPGDSYRTEFELAVHPTAEDVAETERQIQALKTSPPQIHSTPQAGWSAP